MFLDLFHSVCSKWLQSKCFNGIYIYWSMQWSIHNYEMLAYVYKTAFLHHLIMTNIKLKQNNNNNRNKERKRALRSNCPHIATIWDIEKCLTKQKSSKATTTTKCITLDIMVGNVILTHFPVVFKVKFVINIWKKPLKMNSVNNFQRNIQTKQ